jgi:Zn-dependent protease
MNPDLVVGFIEYVVFLLSTTCHEASHAVAAKIGGDMTAFEGGQVTLNPLPHIKREPFGMVVMPLIGITMGSGLIGWASAPYDPNWAMRHPKRAAWMSLAGPAANFSIALLAAILMRLGLALGVFTHGAVTANHIVTSASGDGVMEGIATVLSIFLSLNVLLGCFNLLPVPPLDGWSALPLFVSDRMAGKLHDLQMQIRGFAFIGLLLGWRLIEYIYYPVLRFGVKLVYGSLL